MANLIDIIDDAIRDLDAQASPDITADYAVISQASDSSPKKVLLQNLVGTALAALRSAFTPASSSSAASLAFAEDTDNGAHKITVTAPAAVASDKTLTLPDETGTLATQAYADALVAGLLDLKGSTDCSANPNYPAALKGDAYIVSVAGKIGGASGKTVEVGDMYIASADNAGGTEASVGTSWFVIQANLIGAMVGSNNLSEITNAGTARTNIAAAPATPSVNAQTGTTYTLDATDNGKIVTCSNGSAITVTVPSGLGAGFHCQVVQIGAGQVSFTGSGATVNNRQTHTKIAGQYGVATVESYATDVFVLAGDTAA